MVKSVKWTNVIETQNEEALFEDILREIIASEPAPLPSEIQDFGPVTATWLECEPGVAFVDVAGGTTDDRYLAHCLVRAQLEGHGYRHAAFTFDWDLSHTAAIKEATWDDIMAKAKRLVQDGQVQLLRNSNNNVVAQVQGDHGQYQSEISRDDPNSQSITGWQCDCPWDQFAFQRTRQWKKYEGRPCAHVLATYWKSLSTPTEEQQAEQYQQAQPSLFNQPPAPQQPGPQGPGGFASPSPPPQGEQLPIPGMQPQMAQGTAPGLPGTVPPGNEILPQFPMDPALQPPVAPSQMPGGQGASVPGLRQPSPMNPVQWPGGTYSSWEFGTMEVVADLANSQIVQLLNEDVGTAVGRSEAHGAGQPMTIPVNSIGEVLGTDPTTGMVNVYYTGPCKNNGPMEPHGVTAWHFPSEVKHRPDIRQPGPAIRRK